MSRHRTTGVSLLVLAAAWAFPATAGAAVPRLIFPVVAKVSYGNSFGDPRPQGSHQGIDIMAKRRSKVVAVERGRVQKWTRSRRAGCMLYLHGASGTTYMYIHLNNDRTRRNDNRGGCRNGIAYAPGLRSGERVAPGQLVGYVGNSGDANGVAPHLHFELHPNGGRAVSPYRKLRRAWRHLYQRPPGSVSPLRLRVWGRVAVVRRDLHPDRLRVKVRRVRLSNGWTVRPARTVRIVVPATATVERELGDGSIRAGRLAGARVGERVRVRTTAFPQWLRYARARADVHKARLILLRGT